MRKILLATLAVMAFVTTQAQKVYPEAIEPKDIWRYSPNLSEEELYNHNRLMYMPREDWDLFRQDPRYSQEKVGEVYKRHKDKSKYLPGAGLKAMLTGGDCECYIEPDGSYTMIDPTDPGDWPNCGGGAGQGVDCWYGPIELGWDFCFYGQTYSSIYLTSKGTVVFGGGYYDWTPSEFPVPTNATDPQYNHIAAFWADHDFRESGMVYFKVDNDAVYINFVDVGYYANHADKTNTYQIILSAENSEVLGDGNNVQFCYQDMNWAHGDVGGNGGCTGPTPATVGADKTSGNEHIQFGRFGNCTDVYNGPYGQNNNQIDGVNWLDYKTFEFSVCDFTANIPPISTAALPCDTIYMCQGDVYDINISFLSPEANQGTQITVTQDGSGYIGAVQSGNIATASGSFTAGPGNLGVNEVTFTATDNGTPAGTSTLTYIFLVQDITLPELVVPGPVAFCAGGESEVCASEGFESYDWFPDNCATNCCLIQSGGTHSVTGYLYGCSKTYEFFVDEEPYFIPPFTIEQEPICPGETTTICSVNEYPSYEWLVYPGFDGEVIGPTDQQCVEVTADFEGHFWLIVTDSTGCEGQNIPVLSVTQNVVPEENEDLAGAYCGGDFSPVEFTGGYSSPAEGLLKVYCIFPDPQAQQQGGWQGCYLLVTITNDEGATEYICTTPDNLDIFNLPIAFGDAITIELVCPDNVDYSEFYVQVFNCDNQGTPLIFGQEGNDDSLPFEPGIIWEGMSNCEALPLPGTWTVSTVNGTDCWTLSSTNFYDTNFTPCGYDVYTLCFTDPACETEHCYELIYTDPPTVELNNLSLDQALFCPGETETLCVNLNQTDDPAGTGVYDWSGPNVDENGDCADLGPYTGNGENTITVTLTNECGSDNDQVNIEYYADFSVALEDGLICADGSGAELDPVANDNAYLEYEWDGPSPSITNNNDNDPEVTVNQSGTYSVVVENECFTHEATAEIQISVPIQPNINLGDSYLECNDDEVQVCIQDIPQGYTIAWGGGQNGECIDVTASGNYSVSVTDPLNCETLVDDIDVQFADFVSLNPSSGDPQIVCPGQVVELSLGASNATSFDWTASCDGVDITGGSTANFSTAMVPADCLGDVITITGTATGLCNSEEASFQLIADACFITIPNVFTPGNDSLNTAFYIEGLENYVGAKLWVYNRWGAEVYTSDSYENDWKGEDVEEGTYYFVLHLPYGTEPERKGYLTIIRDDN